MASDVHFSGRVLWKYQQRAVPIPITGACSPVDVNTVIELELCLDLSHTRRWYKGGVLAVVPYAPDNAIVHTAN